MKTIVWRPGYSAVNLRPTTAQQGRPFSSAGVGTGVQLDGELIASVPDTLVLADVGDVTRQILAWGGDCEIVVDTSIAPAVIPAGQVWAGFGTDPTTGAPNPHGPALLQVRGSRPGTALRITDTGQILGLLSLTDIAVTCEATTVTPIGLGQGGVLGMKNASILNVAGSLVPCASTSNSSTLKLSTTDACSLDNSAAAAHPILQIGSTVGDAGSSLVIEATMGFAVGSGAITQAHPATGTNVIRHDPSVASGYLLAQCAALLAVTDQMLFLGGGAAAPGSYTPATGADWVNPDPTTIGAALDRIAAVLAAGGGGAANPIP